MQEKAGEDIRAADIKGVVRGRYDACAERNRGEGASCCAGAGEVPASPSFAAQHGLYGREELSRIPETAIKLSRGCGNPTGFAGLQAGDMVADFGCGAGIDVVLAAHEVGATGKVVGVDFAPNMVERAKQTAVEADLTQATEFLLADLDRVPLADGFADVVISNCVINLCSDKEAVYREAFRVLKPGGRLIVSDIVYTQETDPEVRKRFHMSWAGCLGGSIEEGRYFRIIQDVGFTHVEVVARHCLPPKQLEEMASCPGKEFTSVPAKEDIASVEGKVASIKFRANKP